MKIRRVVFPILAILALAFFQSLEVCAAEQGAVLLTELSPESATQGWGQLRIDKGVGGQSLVIGGREFVHGLGTHAASELVYELAGAYSNFTAWVGVDDFPKNHPASPKVSVVFQVLADGKTLFDSGVMRMGDAAKRVTVSVAGVQELRLVASDAGDGNSCEHADWAEPVLTGKRAETALPAKYSVKTPSVSISLDEQGRIVSSSALEILGQTRLGGCRQTGEVAVAMAGGSYAFTRRLADAQGHSATLTDRFTPDGNSVRWEIEIASADAPWSTPVITRMNCAKPEERLIWTAWGSPDFSGAQLTPELAALVRAGRASEAGGWSDPLVPSGFLHRNWHYGNVAQGSPVGSDYVALPLFTVLAPGNDAGLSLVLAPDNVLLVMDLLVSGNGQFQYTRSNHRLGGGKTVKFVMHLVPHEASWRGGLRFMTERYPQFFEAPNPRAHRIAACGAYSIGEQEIDVAKFKKMAFGFNWKLSDDFPYMGMFIPPVKDADEKWTRSCGEKSAAYKGPTSSCRQMNDYAHYMKTNGFAVLSYFNVTEFGKNMYGRKAVAKADDHDLWKDPVAYLQGNLSNAVFDPGIHTCYSAYITDVGDPDYRRFMLEQADRNTRMLPDTDGICIDRADWLRLYNPKANDGVSWVGGKPARSLFRSWIEFMAQLGPQMHKADKVIFSNMMTMRLELCRELDGIYTEFGNHGGALNASSLLGLRKPVVCWTDNGTLQQPRPDAFMQRHLHMGCFPTAPYPANNHCINPEPKADRLYLDFGPLLEAMRGKKWVLAPHCVESADAKVNLFEVPGGYALPVTFAGKSDTVTVRVRNIPGLDKLKCEAIHPGIEKPVTLAGKFKAGTLELTVPVVRGCAMVLLRNP